MHHRLICLLMAFVLLPFAALGEIILPAAPAGDGARTNRALLVGCDQFLSQQSTYPSSYNNVLNMAQALSGGTMNLKELVTVPDGLSTTGDLAALILDTFADADADDVSLFYISTHGVWTDVMLSDDMTLLLSDGSRENGVTAWQLRTMFDQIEGKKVLFLDACHAGAMIGKGVKDYIENIFAGEDYVVICSSSGSQKSWYWSGDIDGETLAGAGYFSGALVRALSMQGAYGADDNRDGQITLTELKRYLLANHGASTVRTYPEDSDFAILTYDNNTYTGRSRDALIEGVTFESDVLSHQEPTVYFSYNVVSRVQVAYQIVYHRDSRWDFDGAQLIYDNNGDFAPYPKAGKTVSLGMTERAITLDNPNPDDSGYVLLQLLVIEDGIPLVISSRLLCVPPESGDPAMVIHVMPYFVPEMYQELTFSIDHAFPCEMTITVEDMEGNIIRRLSSREPTRPEQLTPMATSYTWDGRLSDGTMAPEGMYRIRVKAYVGSERYEVISDPVSLMTLIGKTNNPVEQKFHRVFKYQNYSTTAPTRSPEGKMSAKAD